jgi:hypothetical protein
LPVTLLPSTDVATTTRRCLAFVTDLAAYTPVANAVEHYRWGLAPRTDDALIS